MVINKIDNQPLVDTFAAAGAIVDGFRLAALTGLLQFRTSERAAADVEQRRVAAKYGSASPQAQTAAARVSQLDMELEALTAEVVRQQTPTPATASDRFVVYGRVLNPNGQGRTKVTVAAIDSSQKALARAESGDLGRFEVMVPLKRDAAVKPDVSIGQNAVTGTTEQVAPAAAMTFQLHLTQHKSKTSYMYDEIFTAVPGQMAYREITVPDAPPTPGPVRKEPSPVVAARTVRKKT